MSTVWPEYIKTLVEISRGSIQTDETRAFHQAVAAGKNIFLCGNAGTGKSHQLSFMMRALGMIGANVVALAPTGVAAVNIGGQTIHSFFRFPITALHEDDGYTSAWNPRNQVMRNIHDVDVIVIDEVSMVRSDVLFCIDVALREARRQKSKPFGGIQIVLMGDMFQLPPVTKEDDVRTYLMDTFGSELFFCVPVCGEPGWQLIELTQVFRQRDEEFSGMLDRIREGIYTHADLGVLSGRVAKRPRDAVCLTATRRVANNINDDELAALGAEIQTFQAKRDGFINTSDTPAEEELRLAIGARVMMLTNDRRQGFFNGSLGTVSRAGFEAVLRVEIDESGEEREVRGKAVAVTMDDGGQEVVVGQHTWEKTEYQWDSAARKLSKKTVGSLTQFPVRLAWAMTIHKAQGLTLPRVHIDLGSGAFETGQAYVALSRATTLDGLTLQNPLQPWDIKVNAQAKWYRKRFSDGDGACA